MTSARPDFSTCDFCDAYKNDSSGDFRVLPPVFRDFGAVLKFCGPVTGCTPTPMASWCLRVPWPEMPQ